MTTNIPKIQLLTVIDLSYATKYKIKKSSPLNEMKKKLEQFLTNFQSCSKVTLFYGNNKVSKTFVKQQILTGQ